MLTQELDQETELYLADILAQEQTTSDELIRNLIRDRWLTLRHPLRHNPSQHPLSQPNLSKPNLSQPKTQPNPEAVPQPEIPTSHPVGLHRPKNNKQNISDFLRRKSHSPLR